MKIFTGIRASWRSWLDRRDARRMEQLRRKARILEKVVDGFLSVARELRREGQEEQADLAAREALWHHQDLQRANRKLKAVQKRVLGRALKAAGE